jgi:hypothetical protein
LESVKKIEHYGIAFGRNMLSRLLKIFSRYNITGAHDVLHRYSKKAYHIDPLNGQGNSWPSGRGNRLSGANGVVAQ